jgi:ELWxxDGT repeat protein
MRAALIPRLLLFLLGASTAPSLAAPHLIQDLNTGLATDAFPSFSIGITNSPGLTLFRDGVLYFRAFDPAHGVELWRSDGSEAGTYRLTDLCPGRCSSTLTGIAISQGHIFLSATDGVTGYELWRSDGTPGSETRVRDLCVGSCNSNPANLLDLGGALLFSARDGSLKEQLWRTDGSRRGTTAVASLCPTAAVDIECSYGMRRVGDRAIFLVANPVTDRVDLWSSDGTPEGTGPLGAQIAGGLPGVVGLPIVNGGYAFFFSEFDLWRTDGTPAGTSRVKELGQLVANLSNLPFSPAVIWNGALYLFTDGALVRSDGTSLGTVRLNAFPHLAVSSQIAALGDVLLFLDQEPGTSPALWRMDATGAAAKIVDLDGGNPGFLLDLTALGDRAVFRVRRPPAEAFELWETDGTIAGTHRTVETLPITYPLEVLSTGTEAFFDISAFPNERQLWKTDGTTAGTVLVHDFAAGPGSSGPLAQAALGGALIFSAQTSEHTAPLFRSDGTAAGTRILSDEASFARGFAQVGSRLFFASSAWEPIPGTSLLEFVPNGRWSTNGTGSTSRIAGQVISYEPLAVLGNRLLFAGGNSATAASGSDVELWSSDAASARRVKNINPFQVPGFHFLCLEADSAPSAGAVIGNSGSGLFVFAAEDGINGRELWVSNGTRAGTRLVADINPQRLPFPPAGDCDDRASTGISSSPADFVAYRGGAIFTADDGVHGRELWITNGTAAGTHRIRDLRPGTQSANPHDLTAFRGAVYFIASTQAKGEALWRTDGTAAGTIRVDDLLIGTLPSWARDLTVAGDQLFFAATNESTGPELWASRGDAASTHLVTDLRPGAPGSYPQELTAVGNAVVFAATDGAHGFEPWRSDGTAAGTRLLGDINPGVDASSPGPFTRAGGFVFTGAYDAEHGREPWAIPVAEVQ